MINKTTELINQLSPNKLKCDSCKKWFNTKYMSLINSNTLRDFKICDPCWEKKWKKAQRKLGNLPIKEAELKFNEL